MPEPGQIDEVVGRLVDFILKYAVTLAAISALSMALIELVKSLLSWRDRFHKQRMREWLRSTPVPVEFFDAIGKPLTGPRTFPERVYEQLIRLTTGDAADETSMHRPIDLMPWRMSAGNALFALSLEKMMGQIQEAADTAMANPRAYSELYGFLTLNGSPDDIRQWYEWSQQPPALSTQDPRLAKQQADTYTRLRQLMRRRLDAFQVSTNYIWATANQIASVALGAVLLFGSLVYLAHGEADKEIAWTALAFASLIGGIMAPVAKDLVIALKRVRSGG